MDVGLGEELIVGREERRRRIQGVGVGEDFGVGEDTAIVGEVGFAELAGVLGGLCGC